MYIVQRVQNTDFGMYECLESCTALVNGCVNIVLFSAVPNFYLHNTKT